MDDDIILLHLSGGQTGDEVDVKGLRYVMAFLVERTGNHWNGDCGISSWADLKLGPEQLLAETIHRDGVGGRSLG